FRLFCRRGFVRGSDVSRFGAGQHRRLSFRPLGGDDDRVRQTLGPALLAEDLVGLGPAGALERDLLQLGLELFLRALASHLPRALFSWAFPQPVRLSAIFCNLPLSFSFGNLPPSSRAQASTTSSM